MERFDSKSFSHGEHREHRGMSEHLYKYNWANNEKRKTMKGRICRLLGAYGDKNSCIIEFTDNRQKEIVSRRALKKVTTENTAEGAIGKDAEK